MHRGIGQGDPLGLQLVSIVALDVHRSVTPNKIRIAQRPTSSTFATFRLMQAHGPKRVYTPQSLEFWFEKLENDWCGAFTDVQLEKGREIYVGGEVRELELTDRDAIVHRRIDKKDEYAVIEWTADGLSVRSSSTNPELAHALAVAGMHEIEELVADEISPLPGEPTRTPPHSIS